MQVKDVLQKTTQFFRDKGFESPRLDTELLIASALRWERLKLYINYEYPLSDDELAQCRELVKRRAAGEPVAYILGRKDFYNHSFKVSPAVLIPRPETESIVEKALEWAKLNAPEARIVDLGTGSGCIGLSLLAELPEAKLLGVDLSKDAIEVATENANLLKVEDRASFLSMDASQLKQDDVVNALGLPADIVVANPPYIAHDDPHVEPNVKKYEPAQALFSPDHGLSHIRAWAVRAADVARAGAFVMFEIGYDQGRDAKAIFEATNRFRDVTIVRDLAGHERFIRCLKVEEN